ncbi:metal ABC transporter permease [Balneolales bacterium ANBcel1]|nr:metal ABC transporter permease [Balneolales bacterium ANBcel1]
MITSTGWILITGILVAASCALAGSFLVLRKMSLMGDAISHAVLPGIAIAFLLTAGRNSVPMLIGAGIFGVLTVYLTEELSKKGRIFHDASMGIVFTTLFAIGVIIISLFAGNVDLDQDCILYGEIAYVPWDIWYWRGMDMGPRPVWILGTVLLINIGFITLFYKELKTYSFSPQLATTLGLPVGLIHYGLMSTVSLTTIGSFESVGAILVVALLIVPPATAYLLTDRLHRLLLLAVLFGITSAVGGYYLALWINSSIAGAIAVVTGAQFALVFLFAPRYGFLAGRRGRSYSHRDLSAIETTLAEPDPALPKHHR